MDADTLGLTGGKYAEECAAVMARTSARGVLLIVMQGDRGTGFSVMATGDIVAVIPQTLRKVADDIESLNQTAAKS